MIHEQGIKAAEEPRLVNGRPDGQLDYELECNIREFAALRGFEAARDFVAHSLNKINDRINRQ